MLYKFAFDYAVYVGLAMVVAWLSQRLLIFILNSQSSWSNHIRPRDKFDSAFLYFSFLFFGISLAFLFLEFRSKFNGIYLEALFLAPFIFFGVLGFYPTYQLQSQKITSFSFFKRLTSFSIFFANLLLLVSVLIFFIKPNRYSVDSSEVLNQSLTDYKFPLSRLDASRFAVLRFYLEKRDGAEVSDSLRLIRTPAGANWEVWLFASDNGWRARLIQHDPSLLYYRACQVEFSFEGDLISGFDCST